MCVYHGDGWVVDDVCYMDRVRMGVYVRVRQIMVVMYNGEMIRIQHEGWCNGVMMVLQSSSDDIYTQQYTTYRQQHTSHKR